MSVALAHQEAWELVAAAHTGILTTIRADGHPVPVPVWFVVLDSAVHVRAPSRTHKVTNVARDGRASFLVEDGQRWSHLRAVLMKGHAELVEDPSLIERVAESMGDKYGAFRPVATDLPDATRRHYARGTATIRFQPTEPIVSWDNRRIVAP